MKNIKQFLAAIIVFILGFAFTACHLEEDIANIYAEVNGLTLNRSSMVLFVNTMVPGLNRGLLVATVRPAEANDAVIWASSNDAVAVVDQNGLVTALGYGTAVIGVSSRFGSFSAVSMLTVEDMGGTDPVFVEGLTLDVNTLDLNLTNNTMATITPTVTPLNATNRSVTWSVNNPAVAIVDQNGVVTAIGPGMAMVVASTADRGFAEICMVTVNP
ncbi:MAG: Ig-like domain-containing protein [Treponema sp.]|nr:Ig-like domain-containing protein [Treponema sp.]